MSALTSTAAGNSAASTLVILIDNNEEGDCKYMFTTITPNDLNPSHVRFEGCNRIVRWDGKGKGSYVDGIDEKRRDAPDLSQYNLSGVTGVTIAPSAIHKLHYTEERESHPLYRFLSSLAPPELTIGGDDWLRSPSLRYTILNKLPSVVLTLRFVSENTDHDPEAARNARSFGFRMGTKPEFWSEMKENVDGTLWRQGRTSTEGFSRLVLDYTNTNIRRSDDEARRIGALAKSFLPANPGSRVTVLNASEIIKDREVGPYDPETSLAQRIGAPQKELLAKKYPDTEENSHMTLVERAVRGHFLKEQALADRIDWTENASSTV